MALVHSPMSMCADHSEISADMEQLGAGLRRLGQDMQGLERRQVLLDRRLVELAGQVQGLQEQQHSQSCALERAQRSVAEGAERALSTAVLVQKQLEQEGDWNQCLQDLGLANGDSLSQEVASLQARFEEQQNWLQELGRMVQAGLPPGSQNLFSLSSDGGAPRPGDNVASVEDRLAGLERCQKAMASGARRALHTALRVHEKQETRETQEEFQKCLETPVSQLEQQCVHRFAEQDERLDKVLRIMDVLTEQVRDVGERGALMNGLHDGALEVGSGELRDKVEELEANLYGLAAQVQSQADHYGTKAALKLLDWSQQQEEQARLQQRSSDSIALGMDSLESRVERGQAELTQRLDVLQDGQDEHQVVLRQISQQVPEVSKRLDQLWEQCQEYFPRVQEQDVRTTLLRASFEAHKQQMLELVDVPALGAEGGSSLRFRRNSSDPDRGFFSAILDGSQSRADDGEKL
eukprot:TRINITY_DN32782_c0_g1_i1.p1 TRINITY_DN32782_c0_g1~~TRINITY_DN32782_c0_g1_i1.p1  ORF type:complete len:480 (+),score=145.84 TRINITY_DN32782_c0_g1_i1:47-1441(+)